MKFLFQNVLSYMTFYEMYLFHSYYVFFFILIADMVLHHFTSMKQTFMTNYRKERESKGRSSGKSPEEIYKPKWILYEKLKFLRKSCAQADSPSNLQSPPLNSSNLNSNIESSQNDTVMEILSF